MTDSWWSDMLCCFDGPWTGQGWFLLPRAGGVTTDAPRARVGTGELLPIGLGTDLALDLAAGALVGAAADESFRTSSGCVDDLADAVAVVVDLAFDSVLALSFFCSGNGEIDLSRKHHETYLHTNSLNSGPSATHGDSPQGSVQCTQVDDEQFAVVCPQIHGGSLLGERKRCHRDIDIDGAYHTKSS